MNTPTTIADAIRQLVKTDNDAPRLIAEALQEIPELGLITQQEAQGFSNTIDEQEKEIGDLERDVSRLERDLGNAEDEIKDLKSELAEAREGGNQ